MQITPETSSVALPAIDLSVAGIEEIVVPENTFSREGGFYRPELDALRFGAFFMVFLCHTLPLERSEAGQGAIATVLGSTLTLVRGCGNYGACLLFLVSAYPITELLQRERELTGRLQ
jgi:peptidoglycan/LPS O-acetylase OafA/YrhL